MVLSCGMGKMKLTPEVRAYFAEIGRRNGLKLREKYGSDYFKKISRMRKRFGRLSKKELRERNKLKK